MASFSLCAFADEAADDLGGQIDAMRANGIGLLELRSADRVGVAQITAVQARSIRARLDAAGIRVWSIGSPTGKIGIADDFAKHLDEFKHMLELADILGATHYRLFSFYGTDGSAAARDAVLERLARLAEAAEGSGLMLCHENEKEIYGEAAPACLEIHKALPGIRAVFDPANFVQVGQDTLEAWNLLAPYVEYVHIKDALADGRVVPAGHGEGHVRDILTRYAAQGGEVVTLEPHLAVFPGLDTLEHGAQGRLGAGAPFRYASQREAFDAAAAALKALL